MLKSENEPAKKVEIEELSDELTKMVNATKAIKKSISVSNQF